MWGEALCRYEVELADSVLSPQMQGKYLEIEFDDQGGPVGAIITNYLLEKVSSRGGEGMYAARLADLRVCSPTPRTA